MLPRLSCQLSAINFSRRVVVKNPSVLIKLAILGILLGGGSSSAATAASVYSGERPHMVTPEKLT